MITEAEIDAAAAAIKLTSSPASSCRSWIACARAALEAAQNVRSDMPEIASLRAELAAHDELIAVLQNALSVAIDKCDAAARQDAEEIARLKEDRITELRNEFEGIRSELETTKRQSFVEGLNEAQRQYYPRVERLEATARQDAEEIARLRGALKDALDYIGGLVHPGALPKWFEDARRIAALACRPQGKVFKSPHNDLPSTSESAEGLKSCRPQGEKS